VRPQRQRTAAGADVACRRRRCLLRWRRRLRNGAARPTTDTRLTRTGEARPTTAATDGAFNGRLDAAAPTTASALVLEQPPRPEPPAERPSTRWRHLTAHHSSAAATGGGDMRACGQECAWHRSRTVQHARDAGQHGGRTGGRRG